MTKKIVCFTVLMASFVFAGIVAGQTWPDWSGAAAPEYKNDNGTIVANSDGWGEDCTNWIYYEHPWDSGDLIYDPDDGFYHFCSDKTPITNWPDMFADLYIELDAKIHLDARKVTIHRYNTHNAQTIEFVFGGWIQSNQANLVALDPMAGHPLREFVFQNGVFGGGSNLPITWFKRQGDGLVIGEGSPAWIEDPEGNIDLVVVKCDHWFQFKGVVELPKHVDDGHYCWQADGCPLPQM